MRSRAPAGAASSFPLAAAAVSHTLSVALRSQRFAVVAAVALPPAVAAKAVSWLRAAVAVAAVAASPQRLPDAVAHFLLS